MAPKKKHGKSAKKHHAKKKKCSCSHVHQTTRVSVGGGGIATAPAPSVVTYATFANPMPPTSGTFPTWESGPGVTPVKQEPSHGSAVSSRRTTRDDHHFGPFTGGGVVGGWLNDIPSKVSSSSGASSMNTSEPLAKSLGNTPSRVSNTGESLTDSHLRVIDRLHAEAAIAKPRSVQGNSAIEGVRDKKSIISHAESDSPAASVKSAATKSTRTAMSGASSKSSGTRMSTGSRKVGSKLASLIDKLNV